MRLIVTGATGSGKSTLIRSISEIEVVDNQRIFTDKTSYLKPKNNIALDFGRLNFSPGMAVHFYGTPGLAKFDFMWELLIRRAHAYILLVAAHKPAEFIHARRLLTFMNQRVQIPMVIGLTHTDCPGAVSKEHLTIALGYANQRQRPTIIKVNPTQKASVAKALITLAEQFDSRRSADDNFARPIAA